MYSVYRNRIVKNIRRLSRVCVKTLDIAHRYGYIIDSAVKTVHIKYNSQH